MTPKINQEAYAAVYISLPWSLASITPGEPFCDDGRR